MPVSAELEQHFFQLIQNGLTPSQAIDFIFNDSTLRPSITPFSYPTLMYLSEQLSASANDENQNSHTRQPYDHSPDFPSLVPPYHESALPKSKQAPFSMDAELIPIDKARYRLLYILQYSLYQNQSFPFLLEEELSTGKLSASSIEELKVLNAEFYIPQLDLQDNSPNDSARQLNVQFNDFYKEIEILVRSGIKGSEIVTWIKQGLEQFMTAAVSSFRLAIIRG